MRSALFLLSLLVLTLNLSAKDVPIMSFFIHANQEYDDLTWEERLPEIVVLLKDYDLIGLQDVDEEQLVDLQEALPEFAFILGESQSHSNVPILYRRSAFVLQYQKVFEPMDFAQNQQKDLAIYAGLHHLESNKNMRVVNTQFQKAPQDIQLSALRDLRKHLLVSRADVNVLLGYFPIQAHEEMYQELNDVRLPDTFHSAEMRCQNEFSTYNTFDPAAKINMRVDYCFSSGCQVRWICIEERIKYGYYLSTHAPLFIILSL